MLTIFGPIQWAFSLLPKWEGAWAKWLTRYLTVHFYGAMLFFVSFWIFITIWKSEDNNKVKLDEQQRRNKNQKNCCSVLGMLLCWCRSLHKGSENIGKNVVVAVKKNSLYCGIQKFLHPWIANFLPGRFSGMISRYDWVVFSQ